MIAKALRDAVGHDDRGGAGFACAEGEIAQDRLRVHRHRNGTELRQCVKRFDVPVRVIGKHDGALPERDARRAQGTGEAVDAIVRLAPRPRFALERVREVVRHAPRVAGEQFAQDHAASGSGSKIG